MLFKTSITALTVVGFTSGINIDLLSPEPSDDMKHSTQLKQKDDRELKRKQRRSTSLLEKRHQKAPVDDAKDRVGAKFEPDVGILRGKTKKRKSNEKEEVECDKPTCVDDNGEDACDGATGKIECRSCLGLRACLGAEGTPSLYDFYNFRYPSPCFTLLPSCVSICLGNIAEKSCLGGSACDGAKGTPSLYILYSFRCPSICFTLLFSRLHFFR